METLQIFNPIASFKPPAGRPAAAPQAKGDLLFQTLLAQKMAAARKPAVRSTNGLGNLFQAEKPPPPPDNPANLGAIAAAAYQHQKPANRSVRLPAQSDWQKYKDDQLLSNPGGDRYHLDQDAPVNQDSFFSRIGKDIADAFANLKNFVSNLFFGAKVNYRDEQGQIQETKQKKGLFGSIIDLCKDVGSVLTLGAWRPDGEAAPQGVGERLKFMGGKLKEALAEDLVEGVGGSINHLTEDLILAGWNLAEVIPDATIGNFEAGRKLTTQVFDNGQVAVDYLTDSLPFGEAWLRVHTPNMKDGDLPVLYNLKLPENYKGDERWQYIRNTPLRKKIETIGALLGDVFTFRTIYPGDKRHHP